MLSKRGRPQETLFVSGSLRDLIPSDHVLVRVHDVLDLSWLHEEVADCYHSHLGRSSIDPEAAVRLMLAGLLLGIVKDRRLLREAQVNLAIRWFAGYDLHEPLPDHSSLSRLRRRWGAARFERIFQRTVLACVEAGLGRGEVVHVDATLIRADVSWESLARVHAAAVVAQNDAQDDVADEAAGPGDGPPACDAPAPPGGRGAPASGQARMVKLSRTDPEARMATSRRDHRLEPSYKQLTAVDGASGVVLDAFAVRADRHEGRSLPEQLERITALTGRAPRLVTADKGYASAANYKLLEERRIDAVIPPQRTRKTAMPLSRFGYDARHDLLRCPRGRKLRPAARAGRDGRFYRARPRRLPGLPARRSLPAEDGQGQERHRQAGLSGLAARPPAPGPPGARGPAPDEPSPRAGRGPPRRGEELPRPRPRPAPRPREHGDPGLAHRRRDQPEAPGSRLDRAATTHDPTPLQASWRFHEGLQRPLRAIRTKTRQHLMFSNTNQLKIDFFNKPTVTEI